MFAELGVRAAIGPHSKTLNWIILFVGAGWMSWRKTGADREKGLVFFFSYVAGSPRL